MTPTERGGLDKFLGGDDSAEERARRVERIRAFFDEPDPEWMKDLGPCWLGNPDAPSAATCPKGPHRGPEGPNEDLAQCWTCGCIGYALRPEGETFGDHMPDCALPLRHESYCEPRGAGHPRPLKRRGYFGPADEAEQTRLAGSVGVSDD